MFSGATHFRDGHNLLSAGQLGGFVKVRRDQGRVGEKERYEGRASLGAHERGTVLADHHRVDDEWEWEARGDAGYRFEDFEIAQGAQLGGMWRNVFDDGLYLGDYEIRGQVVDSLHTFCVLDGDQRDCGFAVDAELVEGFEVGLDSGAAARIRAGYR
jgi:hypothetical protein